MERDLITRRSFARGFLSLGLGLMAGCKPSSERGAIPATATLVLEPPAPPVPVEPSPIPSAAPLVKKDSRFKQDLGIWTPEDIMMLARAMSGEYKKYPKIALAGQLLYANQQKEQSFSNVSPLFLDEPLPLVTVPHLFAIDSNIGEEIPVRGDLEQSGKEVNFTLNSKDGVAPREFTFRESFNLKHLLINASLVESRSDFWLMLQVAKELQKAKVVDMVSSLLITNFNKRYQIPDNEDVRKAIKIGLVQTNAALQNMPASYICWFFAHCQLIPNYLTAVENHRFTEAKDYEELGVFRWAGKEFQKAKMLVKDSSGDYQWNKDENGCIEGWIYLGRELYGKSQEALPIMIS